MVIITVVLALLPAAVLATILFLHANKNKAAKVNAEVDKAGAAIDKATGGKL